MKLINKIKDLILKGKSRIPGVAVYVMSACFLAIASTSCSMVNEDLPDCPPNYTLVDFEYKYNMSAVIDGDGVEKDWFNEHVGSVYLYIFDENGVYYDRREKHKEFFSKSEDFSFPFSINELIPGETYSFVAVAQGNTIGQLPDDNYQWFRLVNDMVPGKSTIRDYILRLDRETPEGFSQIGVVNYKDQYGQNQQMIDTLWTTKPDEVQTETIKKPSYSYKHESMNAFNHITIPMMRITNAITVNLLSSGFNKETDVNKYHIVIHYPNGNGTVDFCGDISQSSQELFYQSLIKNMAPYTSKSTSRDSSGDITPSDPAEEEASQYALKALFGVSRLMLDDDSSLQIRDATKEGYPVITEVPNFSNILAQLGSETGYEPQEFLDREYDFQVDLGMDSNLNLQYMDISCHILGWAKRIHFYDM